MTFKLRQNAAVIFFNNRYNNSNKIISTILTFHQKNANKNVAFFNVLSVSFKGNVLLWSDVYAHWLVLGTNQCCIQKPYLLDSMSLYDKFSVSHGTRLIEVAWLWSSFMFILVTVCKEMCIWLCYASLPAFGNPNNRAIYRYGGWLTTVVAR